MLHEPLMPTCQHERTISVHSAHHVLLELVRRVAVVLGVGDVRRRRIVDLRRSVRCIARIGMDWRHPVASIGGQANVCDRVNIEMTGSWIERTGDGGVRVAVGIAVWVCVTPMGTEHASDRARNARMPLTCRPSTSLMPVPDRSAPHELMNPFPQFGTRPTMQPDVCPARCQLLVNEM